MVDYLKRKNHISLQCSMPLGRIVPLTIGDWRFYIWHNIYVHSNSTEPLRQRLLWDKNTNFPIDFGENFNIDIVIT